MTQTATATLLGLALVVAIWAVPAPAQQPYTRAQIEAMTEAERNKLSYLGMFGVVAPEKIGAVRFLLQRSLAALGYGDFSTEDASDVQLQAAASAFQRRIGAPVTGDLTLEQATRVNKAVEMLHQGSINLGLKFVGVFQGYANAEGTWTMQGQQYAYPFNRTEIECFQERRTCVEAHAYISDGFGMRALQTALNTYHVLKWADDEVQAQIKFECVTNTLFINGRTKSVTMVRRPTPTQHCKSDAYTETRVLSLEDGVQVGSELNRSRFQVMVLDVMSPALLRRYESLSR